MISSTWAEINLDNLKNNLKNLKKELKKDTIFCAVVKADAYGHGSVEISKFLQREGIKYFAVSRIEEAIQLRQNEIDKSIIVLGYIPQFHIKKAIFLDLEITIYSYEMAKNVNKIANELNKIAKIHIKLEAGGG